jgi:adenylate cyclase
VQKLLIALVLATSAGLGGALLALPDFAYTVEMKAYDLRVRLTARPEMARRDIVMVTIDEDSILKLEPQVGRWPWPRLVHAYLVNYLARGPAKVVAYDVLFSERDLTTFKVQGDDWTGTESDQSFIDAVAKAGNVVVVADASREGVETKGGAKQNAPAIAGESPDTVASAYRLEGPLEQRPLITPPFKGLGPAARAVGHVFTALDNDGPLRRMVPFIRVDGRTIPSLAVAAAMIAGGVRPDQVHLRGDYLVLGKAEMPLITVPLPSYDRTVRMGRRALVRFNGPEVSDSGKLTYEEYSFYKLFYSEVQLLSGQKPLIDPSEFRNKIVIVGTTATATHDLFTVPFTKGDMPGMEVHANVIDNILSNRFTAPAPSWYTVLSVVVAAALVGFLAAFTTAWWTIGGALASLAALAAAGIALFARGTWLPIVPSTLATTVGAFGGVAYQYLIEGREKRRIKHVFSRFVAPDVYAHLLADPSRARLGGERRRMSVLFSDIRGFTTVSERRRPEEIVAQLNEYFTKMVEVVFRHHGTIDKFVGDMVMALFGAPLDDVENADHAVSTALDMLDELDRLNERWKKEGRPTLAIGVGVNTGDMVAGNLGSEQVMSYTVIGDAVNLGSRLESLNKQYGTTIIISENTKELLHGHYHLEPLGDVTVKGKTRPVAIFQVLRQPAATAVAQAPAAAGAAQAPGVEVQGGGK